jgi:hypothetical protein
VGNVYRVIVVPLLYSYSHVGRRNGYLVWLESVNNNSAIALHLIKPS